MTATLNDQTGRKKRPEPSAEAKAAAELVRAAKEQGLSLTGPDGLLKQLTKTVLETALNEEMTDHLGYEKHEHAGAGSGNVRNGSRSKTVLTEASGPVQIDVPRDRAGTFEPQIVRKRQRRLSGVDEVVLSLYAKGLTTGEISAHFAEIYGASVSKETISRITDKVIEEMTDWSHRPLDEIYAAVFIDAIVVKVRDGQVANRPFYAAIGVTLDGEKDVLGLWAGSGGEGAKFWMSVLHAGVPSDDDILEDAVREDARHECHARAGRGEYGLHRRGIEQTVGVVARVAVASPVGILRVSRQRPDVQADPQLEACPRLPIMLGEALLEQARERVYQVRQNVCGKPDGEAVAGRAEERRSFPLGPQAGAVQGVADQVQQVSADRLMGAAWFGGEALGVHRQDRAVRRQID